MLDKRTLDTIRLRTYKPKRPRPGVDTRQDVKYIVFPNYRTSGVTLGERRFDKAYEMFRLMTGRTITPLQPFYQYDKATVLCILLQAGIFVGYSGLMWLIERRRRQRAMDLLDFDKVLRDMIAANKTNEQE